MDPILLVGLAALVLAGLALVVVLRGRGPDPALAQVQGALQALADQSAAAQARIQEQERAFTKALDERFAAAAQRLNESLGKSAAETSKTITDLRERLVKIDEAQKHLAELSTRVVGLQDILANKQARGAFGELQLENLVESVLPRSAYDLQATLSNGTRADCVIRLPKPPGDICVDAKFPLESYRALRAADESQRAAGLRAFAADVQKHVSDIAKKYILPGETAEGALMFLPSEAVYAELHASCGEVVDKANRAKVYIVSPTTLWAVLHTMRAVLKDVRMREQAGEIQKMVGLLLNDVRLLDERTAKLQKHFEQIGDDVRLVRTSTERIIGRGERIQEVELGPDGAAAPLPAAKVQALR